MTFSNQQHLQALLPSGLPWPRSSSAALTKLLAALGAEMDRVDARGMDLIGEIDPRSTLELLADWERVAGLPESWMPRETVPLSLGIWPLSALEIASFSRAGEATYTGADQLVHVAQVNDPRIEHDPITGEPIGLMIESAATNLLTYSERFDNAAWTKYGGATVSPNTTASPDGQVSADTLASTSSQEIYAGIAKPGSAITYTFSVYFKRGNADQVLIVLSDFVAGGATVIYNLATGLVSSSYGSLWTSISGTIQPAKNGWFRCSITATSPVTTNIYYSLKTASSTAGSYVYIWGAQLEVGASPTSYTPTVATPVTRPADVCTIYRSLSIQERRAALVEKLTSVGGSSKAYFIALAEAMGYTVEIDTFRPFIAGVGRCGDALGGGHAVRHQWRVRVTGARYTAFRTGGSQCGDLLGKIVRADDLECKFKRLKPAHTHLIVSYEGA